MFDIKSHLPRVQKALDDLGYDFTQFEINDFVRHVAERQQRPILIQEMELTRPLFGAWLPAENADYIFLDPRIHPVQSLHTLIHELAHIILGHHGFDLVDIMGAEAAAALGIRPSRGHLRAPGRFRDNEEDGEAELFAYLLQRKLVEARRLYELYGAISSIESLKRYLDGLNFNS